MSTTTTTDAQPGTGERAEFKGHRWFAAIFDTMNRSMERSFMGRVRRETLADLAGDVLDIGIGTGTDFEFYPAKARVTAIEPDPFMLKRAQQKLTDLGVSNVVLKQAPAERLPFADASFDTVICALVLCTVHDVPQSMREIKRVLRPGGEIRFIEHVRGTGFVGRTQDFIKPVWGYFGAGCNPNRRTEEALRSAGFDVDVAERRKIMRFVPLIRGTARTSAQAR